MLRFGSRLTLAALLVLTSPLAAQTAEPSSNRERSLDLYERSEAEYRRGRFDEAVRLLEEAHRLYPTPVLLYNLARAQESAGKDREALSAYREYLREDPEAADRGAIEKRIESIEARLRERAEREAAVVRAREAERRARADRARPRAEERPVIWPWLTTGAGLAVLATGGVFGMLAKGAESDAEEAKTHAAATEKFDTAERHAVYANVSFVAGGVLTLTGLTWLWLASGSSSATGSVRIYTRGTSIGAALSF